MKLEMNNRVLENRIEKLEKQKEELLEALKSVFEFSLNELCDDPTEFDTLRNNAEQAIKKATT